MSDLFGVGGTALLDHLRCPRRTPLIASLRRVIDVLDFEIDVFGERARSAGRARYD